MTTDSDLKAILLIMDRRVCQLEQRLADVENILTSNSISIKRASHRKVEIEEATKSTKSDQKRVSTKRETQSAIEKNQFKYSKQVLLKLRRDFKSRKGHFSDPFELKSKITIVPNEDTNNPSPSSSPTQASSPSNASNSASSKCTFATESMSSVGDSEKHVESSLTSPPTEIVKKVAHNLVIEEDDD